MIEVGIDPAAPGTPHTLQDVRATFGEYWTANVNEAIELGPTERARRWQQRLSAREGLDFPGYDPARHTASDRSALVDLLSGETPIERGVQRVAPITAEQANERYGHLGLSWDQPVDPFEAALIADRRRRELQAEAVFKAARNTAGPEGGLGFSRAAASVTAELLASVVDPVNIAASLIPFAGPAARVAMASRFGVVGGAGVVGAAEGALGNLLLEPFIAASDLQEQRDWSLLDSFVNVAAGGVLGGGFGVLGGWMARRAGADAPLPGTGAPPAGAPRLPGTPSPPPPPSFGAYAAGWRAALQGADLDVPHNLGELVRASAWTPDAPMVRSLEAVSPETRRLAFQAGFAQLMTGKAIDVEPVLQTDPHWQSPLANPVERLRIEHETRNVLLLAAPEPPRADPLAAPAGSSRYVDLDPDQVLVDARRFQFKEGGDREGVTERLQGVTRWDQRLAGVTIVWRDAAGKVWIVDGHQRRALAARLKGEGQDVQLHALLLDEANGETEGYARALAAIKNIAEGTGTAIDAAKVLREIRREPNLRADLEAGRLPPLPPRSALVRDAEALAKLPDEAFGTVAAGHVPANQAAHVTRILSDPREQTAAIGMLAKLAPDTSEQARLIVEQMRSAGFRQETTVDLFGGRDVANALLLERAKVLEAGARRIKQDAAVFRTLVDREEVAAAAGNILRREANLERLSDDRAALAVLEALSGRAGPIATALNEAARAVSEGKSVRRAVDDFLKTVRAEAATVRGRAGGVRPQLRVARKLQDGTVVIGERGKIHADLVDAVESADVFKIDRIANEMGFATPDGQFLSRTEALDYVKRNEPAIDAQLSGPVRTQGLEDGQYSKAASQAVRPSGELSLEGRGLQATLDDYATRNAAPANERLGDPAAARAQGDLLASARQELDLFKAAEAEQQTLDLLAKQAIEAHPEAGDALQAIERDLKARDELAAAVDGLAACKSTGGEFT